MIELKMLTVRAEKTVINAKQICLLIAANLSINY